MHNFKVVLSIICLGLTLIYACANSTNDLDLKLLSTGFAASFGVDEVSATEVWQSRQASQSMLLVDVRQKKEQAVSIIKGALMITPDQDPWQNQSIQKFVAANSWNKSARIIFYCAAGYRSARSASRLLQKQSEFTRLKPDQNTGPDTGSPRKTDASHKQLPDLQINSVQGGIFAWANAGLPLWDPHTNQTVKKVHGYNESWGQLIKAELQVVYD